MEISLCEYRGGKAMVFISAKASEPQEPHRHTGAGADFIDAFSAKVDARPALAGAVCSGSATASTDSLSFC